MAEPSLNASAEEQLATFLAKYDPEIALLALRVREKLRTLLPPAVELIYDNYNALVIGFSPSERSTEAILSIALYPRWVTLFFVHGAELPDPHGLLSGAGGQIRSIRLPTEAVLDDLAVLDLVARAVERSARPFDPAAGRRVVVRSVSGKQRPRRPGAG